MKVRYLLRTEAGRTVELIATLTGGDPYDRTTFSAIAAHVDRSTGIDGHRVLEVQEL